MMKTMSKAVFVVLLVGAAVQAGTIDVWNGPTGSFWDGAKWKNGGPAVWTGTSTSDELKLTGEGTVCTVDGTGSWVYKLSVASGPTGATLEVVSGGNLGMGEVRVGASGATSVGAIGYVSHTGGTLSVKDIILGRAGSSPVGKGYYTISGGTLTYGSGATGRMYVGGGSGGAYTEGTVTIIGNAASIQMKELYVGSDGTNYGKGTLVYQVGAGGVSAIQVSDSAFLDAAGASSIANLEVSTTETSLPEADIILVRVTGSNALSGTFDAMNGGSAAEGAQIVLAGNVYSLTYQYVAEGSTANDIALVFIGGRKAHTPVPADGATVDTTLALLDWINPYPDVPGNPIYCDVYLGTEANRLSMDKKTLGNDVSDVNINTTNFPTYGNLQDRTQYYWAVDAHDGGDLRPGSMWSFTVSNAGAPTVDAGPDQAVWLGMSGVPGQEVVYLNGTTSCGGPYTVLWTQVPNGAPAVVIEPNDVNDTSVTITVAGIYEFMLTADDGVIQVSDTVQVMVGASAPTADGFGQFTTGGEGGTVVTVTTAADLKSYVESDPAYIVRVSGIIDLGSVGGKVNLKSNKTVEGAGPGAGIVGQLAFHNPASNVIIRRLTVTNPSYAEGDGVSVKDEITNVVVTKCTFYDCGDGCVDVSNASDYVTVSWCKFYYTAAQTEHRSTNLIGSSDSATEDMGKLHVTFHHNWWSAGCDQRMPSVRYGRAHCYNNYYDSAGNQFYCIRTRLYAEVLVENNYFNHVQNPWERYVTSAGGDPGLLHASGNILDSVSWNDTYDSGIFLIDGTDAVFTPPYPYTLSPAEDVPAIVQYGAGADGKDGYPPHWYFTIYGDFDRSGFVDMKDFAAFANYFAITDCEQLWNADYIVDCTVDYRELSLMLENWLQSPPDLSAPAAPTGLQTSSGDGIVLLDWDDNTEEDLAGYNVYRSVTPGSGYTKLNGSLLASSDFTDSTVTNDITYYYVVTAEDTSANESGNSLEAWAYPSAGSSDVTIQELAAGFCGVEGSIDNEHAGYTGTGYCDTTNAVGTGIDWSVNILSGGTYTLTWRYAHGKTDDRSSRLIVNGGTAIASIAFAPTGAFTTWSTVSVDVDLAAGVNHIRLEGITENSTANIDYLNIVGENLMPASCE